ncbi:MAG: hypothetical protein KAW12_29115 [Candidatus Aminicenantes bacterium]|nr:hypothetical protein [Candidatus Aminicenantes bacterium]
MSFLSEEKILKVLPVVFILFFLKSGVFALIWHNTSDDAFVPGDRDGDSIREHIIRGAGSFLKSHSFMQAFLEKIELAELECLDYNQLLLTLDDAIGKMLETKVRYRALTAEADITPYNQDVINQLLIFDYAGFQDNRSLNGDVFALVQSFLEQGDVRGVYHKTLVDVEEILLTLGVLRVDVAAGLFPDPADLWNANCSYSLSLLFGQYVTAVFMDIKE